MSEPRHIYAWTEWHGVPVRAAASRRENASPYAKRYTITEGPEFDALMERARATLPSGGAHTFADVMQLLMDRGDILRDLIAYLGEQP